MPNCFCFKMQPSYQHKLNKIGYLAPDQIECHASKMDSSPAIVDLRLQINTSSNCWPQVGNVNAEQANIHNFRFSSRELYKYYLKNTSYDESLYDYEQWFNHGCTVLLTPQDLNGVLTSPSVQGLCTMSVTVSVYNTLPYRIYVGNGQPLATVQAQTETFFCAGANDADNKRQKLEKFTCAVVGHYSNQYMTFDAKSAQVGAQNMSASFGAGLRLS
jgi:hypothetical protein